MYPSAPPASSLCDTQQKEFSQEAQAKIDSINTTGRVKQIEIDNAFALGYRNAQNDPTGAGLSQTTLENRKVFNTCPEFQTAYDRGYAEGLADIEKEN